MKRYFFLFLMLVLIIFSAWTDEESFEEQMFNLCCNWNEFFYLLYEVDIETVEEDEEFLAALEGYSFIIADTLLITEDLLMFADAEVSGYGELIKAEIEALNARVLELQNCYEKDALDLSRELADCRGLVTALQAENKDMNESAAFMIEEKNKLVEEKEYHLCENKKLSTELADIKSSVERLEAENSSLNGGLSLVTELCNLS